MSDEPPHPLAGASVLLCGATGGIGSALAGELDRRGAALTLAGRDLARLAALPVPGHRIARDLRTAKACAEIVSRAASSGGGVDVVINACGVVAFGPVSELSGETIEDLLATNVLIPMLLAARALPVMRSGGAIVNISGVIAEANVAGMAAYGASKAAVRSFDQALVREARRVGVRVLDARPPHTETGLSGRAIAGAAPALGSGLTPAHVARVICDALESGAKDLPSDAF